MIYSQRVLTKSTKEEKNTKGGKWFLSESKRELHDKIADKKPFFPLLRDLLFLCVFV
jgi:hypothetical protein